MKLYKLETPLGIYWVLATDPTAAETKVLQYLDKADYGFRKYRKVNSIAFIAESTDSNFITDKDLIL